MTIKWKCNLCDDVVLSDSAIRHQMDYCKCGKSALDLEEGYSRSMGDIEVLERNKDETKT